MTAATTNRPSLASSVSTGSSKELRASVRNLLLDISGTGASQRKVTTTQRKSSLKLMDVPDSKRPNRPGSSRTLLMDGSSRTLGGVEAVVQNKKDDKREVEQYWNVVIQKSDETETWGFSFNQVGRNLVITNIKPGGLMDEQTNLEVGMLIVCINEMDWKSGNNFISDLNEVASLMKQSKTLSLRAKKPTLAERSFVEATITKQAKGEKMGFTLFAPDESDRLIIKKTARKGLAAKQTDLRPGYELMAIDNVDCTNGMSLEEAVRRLNQDTVVIRAKKPHLTSGTIVRAVLTKQTRVTPVGLEMVGGDTGVGDDKPRISNIQHDSAAYHSQLEPGFIVEAITYFKGDALVDLHFRDEYFTASKFDSNGQETKGVAVPEVPSMLADLPAGSITIRARVP